ncbi:MAG TPA: Ig-like domain-containing protein, partial [Anaerolineaceae bacterium]|nr:Ig-like domain-containing protein [Anaerolineaceae bacterium]
TVTLTINPVNDAPVAVDDTYNTPEDTELVVPAPGVLANDTDADGETLSVVSVVTEPAHGVLALNADGSFTYMPEENFFGSDTFTYKVADGTGLFDEAVVTIQVGGVNDWPVANDDAYETVAGVTLDIVAPGVLANDVQLDPNESVTLDVLVQPAHGTLTLNNDGSFTYVPEPGFMGVDTFEYQLNSTVMLQGEFSDTAIVTITVNPSARLFLPLIMR